MITSYFGVLCAQFVRQCVSIRSDARQLTDFLWQMCAVIMTVCADSGEFRPYGVVELFDGYFNALHSIGWDSQLDPR